MCETFEELCAALKLEAPAGRFFCVTAAWPPVPRHPFLSRRQSAQAVPQARQGSVVHPALSARTSACMASNSLSGTARPSAAKTADGNLDGLAVLSTTHGTPPRIFRAGRPVGHCRVRLHQITGMAPHVPQRLMRQRRRLRWHRQNPAGCGTAQPAAPRWPACANVCIQPETRLPSCVI